MHPDDLKAIRLRLFLTQGAVAELAGCSSVAVHNMESGRNCVQTYVVEALSRVPALEVEERRRAFIRSALKKLTPMERVALGIDHMAEG